MGKTNPRRSNGTKRNRLVRRVRREEDRCHLCGQRVDKTLPHGRAGSPEVDELIPVTYGGSPYDRANCRLAHRYCNRKRWHGPVERWRAELHANQPRFDSNGHIIDKQPKPRASRQW